MNFFFTDSIMKIKEKSFIDLERARQKLKTTVGPTPDQRLKDDTIRNAWLELNGTPPWSVEKFMKDLSSYEDESLIEEIEAS